MPSTPSSPLPSALWLALGSFAGAFAALLLVLGPSTSRGGPPSPQPPAQPLQQSHGVNQPADLDAWKQAERPLGGLKPYPDAPQGPPTRPTGSRITAAAGAAPSGRPTWGCPSPTSRRRWRSSAPRWTKPPARA